MHTRRYLARYIVTGTGRVLERGALDVSGDRIVALHDATPPVSDDLEVIDLGDVIVMPGLVNAHSHAFQRDLRGRTEWLHADRSAEDFWTWREEMYRLAMTYDGDALEEVTTRAFREMLLSGITCVGEFHYIHHQPDGTPYEDPNALAHRVIAAARAVGIRITLLKVAYHRGGHERAASPEQRRFISPDIKTCLRDQRALYAAYQGAADVKVGVAPHSIRAVPFDWLKAIAAWASAHDSPLHIHACEQREEIRQSIKEYGKEPVHVFESAGLFECNTTLVHATHLTEQELEVLERHAVSVCACPSTERNLGDGMLRAEELLERGVAISLGSDSHAHIDLWDEMRLVDYHERLKKERRNVLASPTIFERWFPERVGKQARYDVASLLHPMGTAHGARDLGWSDLGVLQPGYLADFVSLSMTHHTMYTPGLNDVLSHAIFSASPAAIKDVVVGGRRLVRTGEYDASHS